MPGQDDDARVAFILVSALHLAVFSPAAYPWSFELFMEQPIWPAKVFNIVIVAHRGRSSIEATLFALSLRHTTPDFAGRFFSDTSAQPFMATRPLFARGTTARLAWTTRGGIC